MNDAKLRDTDLNLLFVLHVLLEERSVKAAAARLGVTQSAASHSLAKLRRVWDDKLLVRTSQGLQPTARGADLAEPLGRIFGDLARFLDDEPAFVPETAQRTVYVSTTDYTELILLPPLLRHLVRRAPGIDVMVRPRALNVFGALERGGIDVAFGRFSEAPAGFYRQALFDEALVALVRAGHPTVGDAMTLDEFLALNHVLLSPSGAETGIVDAALAEIGRRRRIALVLPHFLVAPLVVTGTDLVLTLPRRLALQYASMLPVTVVAVPLELPGFTISQIWHERVHRDPGHRWFRAAVANAARQREPARNGD